MPNNDTPTDTQASQAGNKAFTTSAAANTTKKATDSTKKATASTKKATDSNKKAPQNMAKTSSSAKKSSSLPERPKAQASGAGNEPPAQTPARSTKLGAFQPLRGVFNPRSRTEEWIPYEPNSREFILLAEAYNLGMRLLERPDATAKLAELGHRCVKDWKSKAEETRYHWSGDEKRMTEYVSHFLERYRNQATRIGVSAKPLGNAYAESVFDVFDVGYVLPDLFHLDPKTLTTMVLDKELFGQVIQNDARRANLFGSGAQKNVTDMKAFAQARKECADLGLIYQSLLGAIIFHELAHCFVFYLGMNGEPNTPPGVRGLSGRSDTGESGAWLERYVLGGILVTKDNVLYLIDKLGKGQEVDLTRIKEFISKPESFDLKNGLPIKPNGRVCSSKAMRRSEAVSPDTRQRAIFKLSTKHVTAYDVYLGRDANGLAIHNSSPKAVTIAA